MKRLAKEAGLKTTQKFSPDYSSIVLEDDTGRQGRCDLIWRTIGQSGAEWDEHWYALADRMQELYGWNVPALDCSSEETPFDPF